MGCLLYLLLAVAPTGQQLYLSESHRQAGEFFNTIAFSPDSIFVDEPP